MEEIYHLLKLLHLLDVRVTFLKSSWSELATDGRMDVDSKRVCTGVSTEREDASASPTVKHMSILQLSVPNATRRRIKHDEASR